MNFIIRNKETGKAVTEIREELLLKVNLNPKYEAVAKLKHLEQLNMMCTKACAAMIEEDDK